MEALLVTMRFLRTQVGDPRIWSGLEVQWASGPLATLALSGPEEASGEFSLNSLDILSVTLEMNWQIFPNSL